MKYLKIYLIIFYLFGYFSSQANDFHISNYNFADAYLNPSLPTQLEQDVRINLKYRGQWETFANAYNTLIGQVDFNPLTIDNRFCGKKLIITPQIIHDRAGSLGMSNSQLNLNLAYSQFLDKAYKTQIAVGLQIGYTLRSINMSKATFGSDYYGGNSSSLQNIEPQQGHPNLGLGASMTFFPNKKLNFSGGLAAYNLLRSNISYYEDEDVVVEKRYTGYFNANYQINDVHSINGYAAIQYQQPFTNVQVGGTWGMNIGKTSRNTYLHQIFAGAGWRWDDAIIGTFGYSNKMYSLAFNYDFNYTPLIQSSKSVGAFELSFAFATDWFKSNKKCPKPIPCSRFR